FCVFFFQAEDGIRDFHVTGVQTCALPIFYIMFFALLGGIAALTMSESARRPLVGSVPAVETAEEAEALVERQDEDPLIDTSTMPLDIIPAADGEKEPAAV